MTDPTQTPLRQLLIKHGDRARCCPKCSSDDILFAEDGAKVTARCKKCRHSATAAQVEKLILRWTKFVKMSTVNVAFMASPTGRDPWHPVKAEEVPDWVKHPDIIRRLLDGEEVQDVKKISSWYRAVQLPMQH